MKKKTLSLVVLGAIFALPLASKALATPLLTTGVNEISFESAEDQYDSTGTLKNINSLPAVGDYFVGIFQVQNISVDGNSDHWTKGVGSSLLDSSDNAYLTGVFIQKVVNISAHGTVPHLTLAPYDGAVTQFKNADSTNVINVTGKISAGEMYSIYYDPFVGGPFTDYESNGTKADDFAKAVDGNLWASFGYSAGADGIYGTLDDDGYSYSHGNFGAGLTDFAADYWGGLNIIRNFTGFSQFAGISDGQEIDGIRNTLGSPLLNDFIITQTKVDGNDAFQAGRSPWRFRDDDPARLQPVPEPATMLLMGSGLLGLASSIGRRRKNRS